MLATMESFEHIRDALEEAFDQQNCWREHALIQRLKSLDIAPITELSLSNTLELFKVHFLIRHGLYELRSKWRAARSDELIIEAIEIRRVDYLESLEPDVVSSSKSLNTGDLLEQYYLDLSNFYKTTEAEVELMLRGFWQQLQDPAESQEAHALLGLEVGASYQDIKRAFRKHAQRLHPDKGGNPKDFQKIAKARDTLLSNRIKP